MLPQLLFQAPCIRTFNVAVGLHSYNHTARRFWQTLVVHPSLSLGEIPDFFLITFEVILPTDFPFVAFPASFCSNFLQGLPVSSWDEFPSHPPPLFIVSASNRYSAYARETQLPHFFLIYKFFFSVATPLL